jgi:predicted RNase H-like HicB family nuclease
VRTLRKYLIVYEKTKTGYSAYSPDLMGVVAAGTTRKETEKNMYEAVGMHIRGLVEDQISLPQSTSTSEYVLFNEKNPITME